MDYWMVLIKSKDLKFNYQYSKISGVTFEVFPIIY
jgi:hypothetical protein